MKPVASSLLQALALVAVLGLSGCASAPRLPSYATEAEAVAERGEPTARLDNDDGTKTLQYATQPDGTTCLMVQIDDEGKVVRLWDAFGHENLRQVLPGMSKDEVGKMLGPRYSERTYPDSDDEVWEWKVRYHARRGIATLFSVHFSKGLVQYSERVHLHPDGEKVVVGNPYPYPYVYPYPYFYGGSWLWFNGGRDWGGGYRHWRGGGGHRHWGGRHGGGGRWGGRHRP